MSDALPPSKFGAGYTYGGPAGPAAPHNSSPHVPNHQAYSAAPPQGPPASTAPTATPHTATTYGSAVSYPPSPATPVAAPYGYPRSGARPPSGATAILAGILALLSAIYQGWQTYCYAAIVALMSSLSGDYTTLLNQARVYWVAMAVLSGVAALTYIVGAVKLLNRSDVGANWITVGSLAAIGQVVATLVYLNATLHQLSGWLSALTHTIAPSAASPGLASRFLAEEGSAVAIALALTIGIPLLVLILARSRATRQWCGATRFGYGP